MKLIKIEAHGFKSFADPIMLRFDGGVAGIIGPNGSGKSNINDAIKWVLGEQSAKELRGDEMKDVIFSGSKTTKPLDKAIVTLTFENTPGITSYEGDKLSITRILERGKSSNKYLINGKEALKKDILAIAMASGIGKSSLAIISQGTVSDIAQSTDEKRREIFEEAAGISKYKSRKIESLRKLDRTDDSLRNINVILKELENQLTPLRKQAEKALIYLNKSAQLKEIEIAFLANQIQELETKYNDLSTQLDGVQETKEKYQNDLSKLKTKLIQTREQQTELSKTIAQLSIQKNQLEKDINDLRVIHAQETSQRDLIASGQYQANIKEQKEALQSSYAELTQIIQQLERSLVQINQRKEENKNQWDQTKNQINTLKTNFEKNQKLKQEIETELKILTQKFERRTNLQRGPKTILNYKNNFKGLYGLVSELIKVESKYAPAIESALSSSLQNIVVENPEVATKAINFLKNNNGGRATFIPLNVIKEKFIRDDYLLVLRNQIGFIGVGSELVKVEPRFSKLAHFLLGNLIVAKNIEEANKLAKLTERKYLISTLDGDLIRVGGVMVGGTKQDFDDLLGLEDKIKEHKQKLPGLIAILTKTQEEIEDLRDKNTYLFNLSRTIDNELVSKTIQLDTAKKQLQNTKIKITSLGENVIEQSIKNLSTTLQRINELTNELNEISFKLSEKIELKNQLDTQIAQIDELENQRNQLYVQLLESYSAKTAEFEKTKSLLESYNQRLSVFYQMTLENALENYTLNLPVQKAKEVISDLRREIDELGNVNLESIAQLEEVESRYSNLSLNKAQIEEAKNTLLEGIKELDKKIVIRLTNIVNDVNLEFDNVFRSMFGGGKAEVKFVNPNNILESGISIYAQPPGKAIKNLKLFSGGEKSLIAISLLFAILKARPLPLCILDEVEAALDEANVVRYANYLQELKHQTQFIVITHRHGTMERVDHLFGATMQNRGVTSFFSIALNEAVKLLNKNTETESKN